MENSSNLLSSFDSSSNEDNSPSKELALRELASQQDGAVPSSSHLEIVVPGIRDEEDQKLAPQLDSDNLRIGERSAP